MKELLTTSLLELQEESMPNSARANVIERTRLKAILVKTNDFLSLKVEIENTWSLLNHQF
jgi:hypothetical protein